MLPDLFQKRITGLDELTFTDLVGRLLQAEANSIGLPPDTFTYSLEVKVGDEGLDGEARDVPAGRSTIFPEGSSGYQLKAVKGWLSALKLEDEVQKAGSRRILENGGTYVLVWSRELNPKQQKEAESELEKFASKIIDRPKTKVLSGSHIASLCARHPAVPQSLGLVRFGPVKHLDHWLQSLKSDDRPFYADSARQGLIDTIRERLSESTGGLTVRVAGDSGVGKSRAVAEALNTDELRDVTFYAPTTDGLSDFLSLIVGDDQLEAILVVDEVGATDLGRLEEEVAAAGKRIRLVTIGLTSARRTLLGRHDFELGPLSTDAMTELVKNEVPADNTAASFVAEAAEGYPQMAFEILEEIKRDRNAADLSRLAQTKRPRELLEQAVPEAFRRPLGVLALFHSVGCRAELESQLDEIAKQFPVTVMELQQAIKDADDRYIRTAGRRCYVRPKLVATWLAGEILEQYGQDVITWVENLPSVLQDQFVQQLQNFGSGPSTFRDSLGTFIEGNKRFREPPDFDEAAARFLHAAAAVAPEQVVSSIHSLVSKASSAQLKTIPRRDLVWALEYLLWWPETYERAIESLFILAQHESETWANNATGEFIESFQVVLGGTLVPHMERLRWLQAQLKKSDHAHAQLTLIAKAAAAGLNTLHTRTVSGSRGQLEPRDWHPKSEEEVFEAHRGSFDLLLACLDRAEAESPKSQAIVDIISQNLRAAVAFGLMDCVETAVSERDWTQRDRAAISGALRDIRRYDKPSKELDRRIGELLQSLLGDTFENRLAVIFATKPWDLIESDDWHEVPPAVGALVDEATSDPALLATAVNLSTKAPEDGSHFQFFMRCAERIGAKAVAETALAIEPPVWSVLAAALTQVQTSEQADWADKVLQDIANNNTDQFPAVLRSLPLTNTRVDMAVATVQEGKLSGEQFAGLIYGAPIRALDGKHAFKLVDAVGSSASEQGLEGALGMLHQWIEAHPGESSQAVSVIADLSLKAARLQKPGSMISHHLEQLLQEIPVAYDAKARVWNELAVHSDIGSSRDHLWLIQALLDENPEATANLILSVLGKAVEASYPRWAFSLEEGKLLSLAAKATSAQMIWGRLSKYDDAQLRRLLRHTGWAGNEPEPLVRAFLLSERLAELEDEAYVSFANTLGVVAGPFYLATERECDRAKSWLKALEDTSAEDWAQKLVASYEQRAKVEKIQEEEEDLRFR